MCFSLRETELEGLLLSLLRWLLEFLIPHLQKNRTCWRMLKEIWLVWFSIDLLSWWDKDKGDFNLVFCLSFCHDYPSVCPIVNVQIKVWWGFLVMFVDHCSTRLELFGWALTLRYTEMLNTNHHFMGIWRLRLLQWSQKENILLFKLIMSFNMIKVHYIIDTIAKPNEVLTFNQCE